MGHTEVIDILSLLLMIEDRKDAGYIHQLYSKDIIDL